MSKSFAISYLKFAFIFFRLFYQASRALGVLTITALNPVETSHPPSLKPRGASPLFSRKIVSLVP